MSLVSIVLSLARASRSYDRASRSQSRYALKSSTCEQVYSLTAHTFHYRFHQVMCFDVFPICVQLEHNLFFLRRYRCQAPSLKVDLIAIGDKCLFPLVFKEAKELRYAANR